VNARGARSDSLDVVAARYLERQRSLGRKYANEERVIASLCAYLANAHAVELEQPLFEA
jgi:hypothetical protein